MHHDELKQGYVLCSGLCGIALSLSFKEKKRKEKRKEKKKLKKITLLECSSDLVCHTYSLQVYRRHL